MLNPKPFALCLALGSLSLFAAGGSLADEIGPLRLMPRANVGAPDAQVDAGDVDRWTAIAGFPVRPSARTKSGAWIVDLPAGLSPSVAAGAIDALRHDAGILWIDGKGAARTSPITEAASKRATRQLLVRVDAGSAGAARFEPGQSGSVRRSLREADGVAGAVGYTVERWLSTGQAVLRLDAPVEYGEALGMAEALAELPGVRYAEPVGRALPLAVPNDPGYSKQWALSNVVSGINAPAAWNVTTGDPVAVAVIDTGILPHPDIASKILPGYDFITDPATAKDGDGRDGDPTDPGDASTDQDECGARKSTWHGTFVSGIIAASTNNATGVAGVSWGAKILPVRVLGKCGGEFSDVIDGMLWASGLHVAGVPDNPNPAKVLNLSLGGETGGCPASMQEAIDRVVARGAAIVVAAGNSLADVYDEAPAGCGGVISVAAIGKSGDLTSYSNAGMKADIGAPGGDLSEDPTETLILGITNAGADKAGAYAYGYGAGTSFAAPHVAGVLALMLTRNPALTPGQMSSILVRSARAYRQGTLCGAIIGNSQCGAGMLDALAALQLTPTATNFQPATDQVTVIEFYNRLLRHYFLTASANEAAGIDAGLAGDGWARTGLGFRAFSPRGAPIDSSPVCRFYGTPGSGPNSHFYSAFLPECALVAADPGWTFESWAFNVLLPQAGICRPGYKPVYRAYNGLTAVNDANHRYTVDPFEYDSMVQAGWVPEGPVMCAVND